MYKIDMLIDSIKGINSKEILSFILNKKIYKNILI